MDQKDFMQKKDGWCGPASLSYALAAQGKNISQENLVQETGTTVQSGVDPHPLEVAARKYGMETIVSKGKPAKETLALIDWYLKNGWSAVIDFLDGSEMDDGHYSVILKVHKDGIDLFDPSEGEGNRTIPMEKFVNHWLDVYKDGDIFRHYVLLIHKK